MTRNKELNFKLATNFVTTICDYTSTSFSKLLTSLRLPNYLNIISYKHIHITRQMKDRKNEGVPKYVGLPITFCYFYINGMYPHKYSNKELVLTINDKLS